jgi:hypothetical protein
MSTPRGDAPLDPLLVSYLLGALPDHETERLDELSVADDDFAIRLRATEHDLVDAYVTGELYGETLDRFRSHYLSTRAGRQKVTFAETLFARQQIVDPSDRQPSRASWRASGLMPQWAAAAVALIAVTIAGVLFADNVRLRREAANARAAPAQRTSSVQPPIAVTPAPESTVARNTPAETTPLPLAVLLPSRRGAADVLTIAIPRSGSVTLQLVLEFDDFPQYTIELSGPGRTVVWRGPIVAAASVREGRAVSATIPVSVLKPERYVFEVSGRRARAAAELVGS